MKKWSENQFCYQKKFEHVWREEKTPFVKSTEEFHY
jgi:hypothetical protein